MRLWAAFYLITVEPGLRAGDVRAHAPQAAEDARLSWALGPLSFREEHLFRLAISSPWQRIKGCVTSELQPVCPLPCDIKAYPVNEAFRDPHSPHDLLSCAPVATFHVKACGMAKQAHVLEKRVHELWKN